MTLQYPGAWKFENTLGELPLGCVGGFKRLVSNIADGTGCEGKIFETFKSSFGVHSASSDASWAETDLFRAMGHESQNMAKFVAAFWNAIEELGADGISVPTAASINRLLSENNVPLRIVPPNLELLDGDLEIVEHLAPIPTPIYHRKSVIGQGGFGTVYLVQRVTSVASFPLAMKVFAPSVFNKDPEKAKRRFKIEIETLHKLQHRGIVQYIEAGVDGEGNLYIVMPFIEGTDIRTATSGQDPQFTIAVFDAFLEAMSYSHQQGVLHRDIKPANIIVRSSDSQPIVLDFGFAYWLDNQTSEALTSTQIGTRAYIPVEVMRNPKHRSTLQDIYAAGIMLYEMFMGAYPENSSAYARVDSQFPSLNGIDEVIQLAIDSEDRRISSFEEFRLQLASLKSE